MGSYIADNNTCADFKGIETIGFLDELSIFNSLPATVHQNDGT